MTADPIEQSTFRPIGLFLLASLVFIAAGAIAFGDLVWSSERVISLAGTDIWRQNYAWELFGYGELARGHLALWNPYIFSGAPYFAGFQSALLYPPNWLHLAISMPRAMNLEALLHIVLAGICMYCWASYRRLHWLACVSAGLIFMFSGPNFGQLLAGHIPHCRVMAWTPLIFLAIDDLTAVGSIRAIFLGSAAVALQVLAGHPQYVFYVSVAAGIYLLLNLIGSRVRLRAIVGFIACYVVGALLSAVQLLTGLQAAQELIRTKVGFEFTSTFSFPPENLLTLFLPNIFGNASTVPYFGRWFYWEVSMFVGLTGVVLALLAFAAPRRQRRFGFTMLVILLLLAMGKYTPVGRVVLQLPGFDGFRGITKFTFLFDMFLALLAGIGFDWLLRGGRVRNVVLEYLGGSAVLFAVAAIMITASAKSEFNGAWGRMLHSIDWTHDRLHPMPITPALVAHTAAAASEDLWWAAGTAVLLVGLLAYGRREPRAYYGLAALLAVELIVFAYHVHSSFSISDLQKNSDALVARYGDSTDTRIFSYDQGELMLQRRLNSWGDDPMMLRRYIELLAGAVGMEPQSMITLFPDARKMLSRIGVPAWKLTRTGWFSGPLQGVNPDILLPRAALIGNVQVVPDHDQLVRKISDLNFDPFENVLVESPISPAPAGGSDLGQVSVTDIDSDTLEIDATASAPCLLLVTDAYSSGWQAEAMADSVQQKYDVIPADLAFRGIPLGQAGHHHLRLFYRPTAFVIGQWITIVSLIGYAIAMVIWLLMGLRAAATESAPVADGA